MDHLHFLSWLESGFEHIKLGGDQILCDFNQDNQLVILMFSILDILNTQKDWRAT